MANMQGNYSVGGSEDWHWQTVMQHGNWILVSSPGLRPSPSDCAAIANMCPSPQSELPMYFQPDLNDGFRSQDEITKAGGSGGPRIGALAFNQEFRNI